MQGVAAPDRKQPLAAGRRGHLDVEDVEPSVGFDGSGRAGGLMAFIGIEQAQIASRADVKHGQVSVAIGADLDPHPVAGMDPDLLGRRWDSLHVAGRATDRLSRMARGDGDEGLRPDLAADDQV
jgi:hypothetical protein